MLFRADAAWFQPTPWPCPASQSGALETFMTSRESEFGVARFAVRCSARLASAPQSKQACANVHQREAEQIQATPGARAVRVRIIRSKANAPNLVDWTGFDQDALFGAAQKVG